VWTWVDTGCVVGSLQVLCFGGLVGELWASVWGGLWGGWGGGGGGALWFFVYLGFLGRGGGLWVKESGGGSDLTSKPKEEKDRVVLRLGPEVFSPPYWKGPWGPGKQGNATSGEAGPSQIWFSQGLEERIVLGTPNKKYPRQVQGRERDG